MRRQMCEVHRRRVPLVWGSSRVFFTETQTDHSGEWGDVQPQDQFPGVSQGCRGEATAPCSVAASRGSFVHEDFCQEQSSCRASFIRYQTPKGRGAWQLALVSPT